ncbi:MAG: ABC transporter substrate-binding protein [Acidiferrobacterales bacterium]|nr:ABC transporter substrate-binding protein [Acidiferrobacterales bacterium]
MFRKSYLILFFLAAHLIVNHAAAQSDQEVSYDRKYKIFAVVWRGETAVEAGFQEYLNQRGIPYEMTIRNLNLDRANAPGIIEEIKQVKPDLVYTWGTGTTLSIFGKVNESDADGQVTDIPGIFVLVAYPVSAGIVESFQFPGRNVTGVAFLASIEAQINAMLAYRPFKKMAVIYDETQSNSRINVSQLKEVVPQLGIELLVFPIPKKSDGLPDPDSLPGLVAKAKEDGAEILYMGPDSFIFRHGVAYTDAALKAGLPTFASTQAPLRTTRAMFGLVSDYHTLGKLAAVQAERILVNGDNASKLSVARLSRFQYWINIDVASELGLYPPMNVISIAEFKRSNAQ